MVSSRSSTNQPEPTPFSVKAAEDSSGFLLWQVTALWQRQVSEALKAHGLTQVQYALLASLLWLSRSMPEITQVALARHAKMDVMMTSQVLRALEARGLVKRGPHPTDTRAKVLSLTAKGVERATRAVPAVEQADAKFFEPLAARRGKFNQFLQTLIKGQ